MNRAAIVNFWRFLLSRAPHWQLEHIISATGMKTTSDQVLISPSVLTSGLRLFPPQAWLTRLEKDLWDSRKLTGEQLEIPSPPKKNSSPYATIAVCLTERHKIEFSEFRSEQLLITQDAKIRRHKVIQTNSSIITVMTDLGNSWIHNWWHPLSYNSPHLMIHLWQKKKKKKS